MRVETYSIGVGFRARLNFGNDARVTRARTNFQTGTSNNELDFQELYAEYIVPLGTGLKVQFGKMNTLIGYEVINSAENVNFSRSFMFGLGQALHHDRAALHLHIQSVGDGLLRSRQRMGQYR